MGPGWQVRGRETNRILAEADRILRFGRKGLRFWEYVRTPPGVKVVRKNTQ